MNEANGDSQRVGSIRWPLVIGVVVLVTVLSVTAIILAFFAGRSPLSHSDNGSEEDRFIQVAAGGAHSCALSSNGSVSCWGSDEFGQLRAPADERFTSITAGNVHSCGLRSDGTAVCWGSDIFAQFEDNSEETERRFVPVFPPKDERFTSISAGGAVNCGQREDGDAVCWEVLPDGRGEYSPVEMEKVMEISTGAANLGACGLRSDGSVVCWHPVEISVPPQKNGLLLSA